MRKEDVKRVEVSVESRPKSKVKVSQEFIEAKRRDAEIEQIKKQGGLI